jgi:guanosine-3',5'-bis(diphosphate) 3'-pyrophosphohydrolase
MTLIQVMEEISDKYHNKVKKQVRKYTGEPYTVHTKEVADTVFAATYSYNLAAAAHGHDLFEDTGITPDGLRTELAARGIDLLNPEVDKLIGIIIELTDVYTSEKYPYLNRSERKKLEAARLGTISDAAKTVKLADLKSNTKSIVEHDKGFAKIYLKEKEYALGFLKGGDDTLWQEVKAQLSGEMYLINT